MATIFLTRHGQTDWNAERRWQGHADPPLNEHGHAEAHALAESLVSYGIEAIYSSDLVRAARRQRSSLLDSGFRSPSTRASERLTSASGPGSRRPRSSSGIQARWSDGARE